MRRITFLLVLLLLVVAAPAFAQFGDSRDEVGIEIIPQRTKVAPGSDVTIAVVFDIGFGWHIYSNSLVSDDYKKTIIDVTNLNPDSITAHAGFTRWPTEHPFEAFGELFNAYEGRAIAYIPVTISNDAVPGKVTLKFKPAFQTCNDITCLPLMPYPNEGPPQAWLDYGYIVELEIVPIDQIETLVGEENAVFADFDASIYSRIRAGEEPPNIVNFDLFDIIKFDLDASGTGGLVLLMIVALIGGFILNLTPCVLPVIPLKIMGLAQSAGTRRRTFFLGVIMSLGVIGFWVALGAAIAFLKGFSSTNQLFQYPLFTIGVGLVIAVMAVGMCGLFTFRLPQAVYKLNPSHDSIHGSFGFGIMTAILSTPCTAPFMGAALAWAATQQPLTILMVFAAIGVGMAFPYLLLSAFPQLARKMPKTGRASELIKQVLGLAMLAAAALFIGIGIAGLMTTPPDPPPLVHWWVVAILIAVAGGWLAWGTWRITKSGRNRATFCGLGIVLMLCGGMVGLWMTSKGPIEWTYYTPERFAEAKAKGDVVVMEFTAEWCLNCKYMEKKVLYTDTVSNKLNGAGVTPIKVDLTGNNEDGNAMLNEAGRLSIPLLVVFSPDGREVFKGDFYTVEQVMNAIAEVQGTGEAMASH